MSTRRPNPSKYIDHDTGQLDHEAYESDEDAYEREMEARFEADRDDPELDDQGDEAPTN